MLEYNNRITGSELFQLNRTAEQFNKQLQSRALPNEGMGKDDFLKLLTVQLSHQNPLKPMDNTAFISQMAQFSSLEQMQNVSGELQQLREEVSQMRGASLIGKQAKYIDEFSKVQSGRINKLKLQNGQKMEINGQMVELNKIISIEDIPSEINTNSIGVRS